MENAFDVVILGAGPGGLSAAYSTARQGMKVAVVEKSGRAGGLMQGLRRGSFFFDIGRKELYSRFPEVHALWSQLLGDDFRVYPHTEGILYEGRILDIGSRVHRRLRGLSLGQLAQLAASYACAQIRPGPRLAERLEDYYLLAYGRAYYDFFYRGFNAKFYGDTPEAGRSLSGPAEVERFAALRRRLLRAGPGSRVEDESGSGAAWRHPARGTGQIAERLEQGAREAGAVFVMNAEVRGVAVQADEVRGVDVRHRDGTDQRIHAPVVMSALPMHHLMRVLVPAPPPELHTPPEAENPFNRSVALVYLMADGAPRFAHNWLNVTDPKIHAGRIVNYATWNGEMVPPGKTGLCVEYFGVPGDAVFDLGDDALTDLARNEVARAHLLPSSLVFDSFVLRLPNTNAATQTGHWKVRWMMEARAYAASTRGLYEINRPGIDRATLAGLDAAAACAAGKPMSERSLQSVDGQLDPFATAVQRLEQRVALPA